MARQRRLFILLAVIASLFMLCLYHALGAAKARVVSQVFDGDTICLDDGSKVRLIGVDAPEVDSPYSKLEPFGLESKAWLASFVLKKQVRVSLGDPPKDKYGRTLAYVYVDDVLVNGRMIREGWARAYRQFHHPWRDLFITYEREAKSKGLGMWRDNR
ncbi:MAG: thermonuclease family protein [Desulfobacterota bacterium]|jgi:micrococcal nuclease|nr:thermonuclease family protein [Thermodesulfobacteriota bacterium]